MLEGPGGKKRVSDMIYKTGNGAGSEKGYWVQESEEEGCGNNGPGDSGEDGAHGNENERVEAGWEKGPWPGRVGGEWLRTGGVRCGRTRLGKDLDRARE